MLCATMANAFGGRGPGGRAFRPSDFFELPEAEESAQSPEQVAIFFRSLVKQMDKRKQMAKEKGGKLVG